MSRKRKKGKKSKKIIFICIIEVCIIIAMILGICLYKQKEKKNDSGLALKQEVAINLGYDMSIIEVGKYTGVYMEDGSDEDVEDVLMIVVKNEGENTIQYAEVSMPVGDKTASFALSTLPPESTMIVLEKTRMPYEESEYTTAVAENVAVFQEPISLCEDKLTIQSLDGVMNITNISDEDINEDITIYYKNSAPDVLYGGITYRVRIEGGLKKDEIRQIAANHFSEAGSKIMFVTCGME